MRLVGSVEALEDGLGSHGQLLKFQRDVSGVGAGVSPEKHGF